MPTLRLPNPFKRPTLLGACALVMLLPGFSWAALGGQEASVADDAVAVKATIKSQQRSGYRMHEMTMPSGTVVHEFVAANGTVFAVAWRGPTLPNLKATLGNYFDTYVDTARLKLHPHRSVQLHEGDLVIESFGHMRSFTGLAYLPKALPAGVTAGDLK